jgi:hypothetical protein
LKTWWLDKCGYWGLPCDTTSEGFWAMLGAIGTVTAAFITFLAVVLSLWQSWKAMQDVKTKLKITFSTRMNDEGLIFLYYEAVNFGSIPVNINRIYFGLPNKVNYHPIIQGTPKRLENSQHTGFHFELGELLTILHEKGYKSGKIKFNIIFVDYMQNRYIKGFKFDINEWKKIATANGQEVYDLLKKHNFQPESFENVNDFYEEIENSHSNNKPVSSD